MIQFNLLPDVKQEFISAQRRKRTVMALATLLTGGSVTLLVITFLVANVWQKVTMRSLDREIKANTKKLEDTPDIDKILTIQNQLNSLPALHAQKPVGSRLFLFLTQVTPAQATISRLQVNFETNTMTISGAADKLETINRYVDTLKFTMYATTANAQAQNAFSDVVMTEFARDEVNATYAINLVYNPEIFAGTSDGLQLIVPKITTTRSETERPTELFKIPPTPTAPGTTGQ